MEWEKQTQFKANTNPIKPNSNPNKANQTQPVVSLSNLFQRQKNPPKKTAQINIFQQSGQSAKSITIYQPFLTSPGSLPSSIAVIFLTLLKCLPPLNSVFSQASTIFRSNTSPSKSAAIQSTFASLWWREI